MYIQTRKLYNIRIYGRVYEKMSKIPNLMLSLYLKDGKFFIVHTDKKPEKVAGICIDIGTTGNIIRANRHALSDLFIRILSDHPDISFHETDLKKITEYLSCGKNMTQSGDGKDIYFFRISIITVSYMFFFLLENLIHRPLYYSMATLCHKNKYGVKFTWFDELESR